MQLTVDSTPIFSSGMGRNDMQPVIELKKYKLTDIHGKEKVIFDVFMVEYTSWYSQDDMT